MLFSKGLGDFVFYSVLVSKAALYSFTAWAVCVVVIVFGLGATLVLLAVHRMALPVRSNEPRDVDKATLVGPVFFAIRRLRKRDSSDKQEPCLQYSVVHSTISIIVI